MRKHYIIYVKEGRGKTGNAKTGKVRMLLLRDEDMDNLHDFFMHARQWVIDNGGNPLPMREYFAKSCANILGQQFRDIYHLVACNGSQVCFVNTTRVNQDASVVAFCKSAMESHEKEKAEVTQ